MTNKELIPLIELYIRTNGLRQYLILSISIVEKMVEEMNEGSAPYTLYQAVSQGLMDTLDSAQAQTKSWFENKRKEWVGNKWSK
jgi:hypothetical protein